MIPLVSRGETLPMAHEDTLIKNLEKMQAKEHLYGPAPEQSEELNLNKRNVWADDSQDFWAMLKADSAITELEGKKQTFIVPQKIFVRAHKEKKNDKYYFLYNKENKILYKTAKDNIIAVEDVANLKPSPKSFSDYGPPREYDAGDTELLLKTYYALHFEAFTYENETARAFRNELKMYYGWKFPLEFGLSLSLQNGQQLQSETSPEAVPFQSFFIGPMIRYLPYKGDFVIVSLETSFQKSINHKKEFQSGADYYSSDVFEFGTESIFPTFLGQFTAGLHWRTIRNSLISSDDQNRRPSIYKNNQNSFAFSFGYGREFFW